MKPSETRVDNTALREAFERASITACELARRLDWLRNGGGWSDGYRVGDGSRAASALGIKPSHHYKNGKKYVGYRRTIDYDLALRIMRALDLDPVDVGL